MAADDGSKEASSTINGIKPASTAPSNSGIPNSDVSKNDTLTNPDNDNKTGSGEDANSGTPPVATPAPNVKTSASDSGPLMKVVVSPLRGPVELLHSTDGAVIIYTDASLLKDGTAGIGIYFGKDHPLNTSERLTSRHTSIGWAEIIAATTALQKLREWPEYKKNPVILRTDCLTLVEAMQCTSINERTHHRYFVELKTLRKIAEQYPHGVQFEHVYAHNGEEGNEEADALATKATSNNNLPSPRRTRSKPPSPRMSRRTRSVYIKRSAPAKINPKAAKKASKIIRRRSAAAAVNPRTALRSTPTVSYIPPPDIIARRDMKQHELGADTPTKVQQDNTQSDPVEATQSLSMDKTQPDMSDKTQSDRSDRTLSENKNRSLHRTTSSHSRFGASRIRIRTPLPPSPIHDAEAPGVDARPVTSVPAEGSRKYHRGSNSGLTEAFRKERRMVYAAGKYHKAYQNMEALRDVEDDEEKKRALKQKVEDHFLKKSSRRSRSKNQSRREDKKRSHQKSQHSKRQSKRSRRQ